MAVPRPENAQRARPRLLRDDGPRSRAQLGDTGELPRRTPAVEKRVPKSIALASETLTTDNVDRYRGLRPATDEES